MISLLKGRGLMLKRIDTVLELEVVAEDGYCGKLVDLYFDEVEWEIRYVVIIIEETITGHNTLVIPGVVRGIDWKKKVMYLNITKEKLYQSPEAAIDLPLSRHYEIALHRYYEWPVYWGQVSFLDTPQVKGLDEPDLPSEELILPNDISDSEERFEAYSDDEEVEDYVTGSMMASEPVDEETVEFEFAESEDEEITYNNAIRSVKEIEGYQIHTADEDIGFIKDCIINIEDWAIRFVLVTLDPRSSRNKTVLLPVTYIRKIKWQNKDMYIDVTLDDISNAPQFIDNSLASPTLEQEMFTYYDSRE